jgi:hypothetical protein
MQAAARRASATRSAAIPLSAFRVERADR